MNDVTYYKSYVTIYGCLLINFAQYFYSRVKPKPEKKGNQMPVKSKLPILYYKRVVNVLKQNSSKHLRWLSRHKVIKAMLIVLSVVTICIGLVIIFISPIAKYLVEKYDLKYTGRQITMDWAYVNPFTGYVHFDNLKIYELKSDSIFLSASGLSANFGMRKILSKTYEIRELTLNHPRGIIIQIDKDLNFGDLIKKFSKKVDSIKVASPVHFSILSFKIIDGEIYYRERVTPINYFIKKVNIESTGIRWDSDTTAARFSFLSGTSSGSMNGNFTINIKTMDFRLAVVAQKFDLDIVDQYLRELTNFGYFTGNIDADLKVKGSFKTAENVSFSGPFAINDFHTGEKSGDDYASFHKLTLAIIELSPNNHKYLFDSISLNNPYFKYERYDYLDNLQRMFVSEETRGAVANTPGAKFNLVLEIGNYIKKLSYNFFQSNYKLNRLAIYSGDLEYNDFSVSERFAVHLNPLYITADSIAKNQKRVSVTIKTGIKPYGDASITLSINPNDSSDFDLTYLLQKLPVAMFNPYFIQNTSFPLDRGTLMLNGSWNVRNGIIKSNNHLIVIDPRLTKRSKLMEIKWLPMRLIMAFTRETGNIIDYEIPISGNLKDPKFHLKDVILDIIRNIFMKPATTPYRIMVKNTETEIEKTLTIKWAMHTSVLSKQQNKFIEKMADYLLKNPDAVITVSPQQYSVKEKEYILFYEAKKKYFLVLNHKNTQSFSQEDAVIVEKMSVRDSLFARYLDIQTADSMLFTVQDKCNRLMDGAFLDTKYKQLNKEREAAFMSFFKNKEIEKQINIAAGHSIVPYNGFTFYNINYKGKYPESVLKAYRRMNDLNDEFPRSLFKKDRKKIKGQTAIKDKE